MTPLSRLPFATLHLGLYSLVVSPAQEQIFNLHTLSSLELLDRIFEDLILKQYQIVDPAG